MNILTKHKIKMVNWIPAFAGMTLVLLFFAPKLAFAANNCTWTNGAGTNSWNNASNWSNCGGVKPAAADTAIFDSANSNTNVTVDTTVNITGWTMQNSYSGTISQGANTITVGATGWTQSAGTFTGGSVAISDSGTFNQTGGTFTSTTGTFTYTGTSWTVNGATWTANGGSVIVQHTGTVTFTAAITFNNVTFTVASGNNTTTESLTAGAIITVNGTLTLSTGSTAGTCTLNGPGTLNANGDVTMTNNGCLGSGVVNLTGTGTQNVSGDGGAGFNYLPGININKSVSGTANFSNTISVELGGWTYTAGSINMGTSTIQARRTGSATFTGSMTFYNLTFTVASGALTATYTIAAGTTMTVSNTLLFTTGSTAGNCGVNGTGTITANADVTISNNGCSGTAVVTLGGSGGTQNLSGDGGAGINYAPGININNATGTINVSNTITVDNGGWVYTAAGTLNMGTSTIQIRRSVGGTITNLSGSMTFNNLTFSETTGANTGTYTIGAGTTWTVSGTLTLTGGNSSSNCVVNGTGTITANGGITVSNNGCTGTVVISIAGSADQALSGDGGAGTNQIPSININKSTGTLSLSNTIRAATSWTYSQGTVNPGSSTVEFNQATNNAGTMTGSMTLNNVTFMDSSSTSRVFTFASGAVLTISGTLLFTVASTGACSVNQTDATSGISAQGAINITSNGCLGTILVTVNGSADQTITGNTSVALPTMPGLGINKATGILSLVSTITVTSNTTYTTGTVSAGTSTIQFNASGNNNETLTGSLTLANVTFTNNSSTGRTFTVASGTSITATGTLSMDRTSTGTCTINGTGTIQAQGDVTTGTNGCGGTLPLLFTGNANQNFTPSGTSFPTGTVTVNKSSGTVTLANNFTLTAGQAQIITSGTFDMSTFALNLAAANTSSVLSVGPTGILKQGSGTLTFNTLNISKGGTFNNASTGGIVVGTTGVINSGTINLGVATSCGGADNIAITSSAGGTARNWNGIGSFNFYDIAVTDQNEAPSKAGRITAYSSTNNGNSNFSFKTGCQTGPAFYWKFDEASGTSANDSSKSGNTGTLGGSTLPTWQNEAQCVISKCLFFDGTSSKVTGSIIVTNAQAISLWVKPSSITSGTLIDLDGGTHTLTFSSGAITANGFTSPSYYINGVPTAIPTLTVNQWQLVTVTTGTAFNTSSSFTLATDGTHYTQGYFDEVKAFSYALSPSQVRSEYDTRSDLSGSNQLLGSDPTSGNAPVSYYNFDEAGGSTANDRSTNANTGTWAGTGSPHWLPGKFGSSGNFNGSDDIISVGTPASLTNLTDKTVSAWVYLASAPGASNRLVSKEDGSANGWDFTVTAGRFIGAFSGGFSTTNPVTAGSTAITLKAWTYVTGTFNSTTKTWSLYINGSQSSYSSQTAGVGTAPNDSASSLAIGASSNVANKAFNGQIDDLKIYNYVRTQKQIIADMNGGQPSVGSPAGSALGYWKFDEGSDNTCSGGTNDACNTGNGSSALDLAQNGMSAPSTTTSGWQQAGKFNRALAFDGSNDYLTTTSNPGSLQITANLALTGWVKLTDTASTHDIIAKDGASGQFGYRLFTDSSGKLNMEVSSDGTATKVVTGNTVLSSSSWYYVAAVYIPSTSITLYINGVQDIQSTSSIPSAIFNSSANLNIGGQNSDGATNLMKGLIDEVKVYSFDLTSSEIAVDYNRTGALVLGARSINSGATNSTYGNDLAYCIPGDASSCGTPLGEWNLEGTPNDTSGNSYNGTWNGTGTPHYGAGKLGLAGNFNGTTDYVSIGTPSNLNNLAAFTAEAWINPSTLGQSSRGRVFDKSSVALANSGGNGWTFFLDNTSGSNSISFIVAYPSTSLLVRSSTVISLNSWTHVAVTWDGSSTATNVHIYINGREGVYSTQTNAVGTRATDTAQALEIGDDSAVDRAFAGKIDQARIYNYVRNRYQVGWDYTLGNPMAWYKMDDCSGSTLHDSSGNTFDLTLTTPSGVGSTQSQAGTCNDGNTASAWNNGVNGRINYSINFDGIDDNATTASTAFSSRTASVASSQLSWGGWFYPTGSIASKSLIEKASLFHLTTDASGNAICGVYNTGGSAFVDASSVTAPLALNAWNQVLCTYDGSNILTYVNGLLKNTTADSNAVNDPTSVLYIAETSSGTQFYQGQIDDIRFYNYTVPAILVKNIYNNGAPVRYGPLTGAP